MIIDQQKDTKIICMTFKKIISKIEEKSNLLFFKTAE